MRPYHRSQVSNVCMWIKVTLLMISFIKFLLTIFTGIDYCPVLEYSCSTFSPRSAIYERRAAEPGAGVLALKLWWPIKNVDRDPEPRTPINSHTKVPIEKTLGDRGESHTKVLIQSQDSTQRRLWVTEVSGHKITNLLVLQISSPLFKI